MGNRTRDLPACNLNQLRHRVPHFMCGPINLLAFDLSAVLVCRQTNRIGPSRVKSAQLVKKSARTATCVAHKFLILLSYCVSRVE